MGIDYISGLQAVLQMLMTSGSINKLPDNLQWQIRTLLPRKDGKVATPTPVPEQTPASEPSVQHQITYAAPQCATNINLAATASMQLPVMPMTSQVGNQLAPTISLLGMESF